MEVQKKIRKGADQSHVSVLTWRSALPGRSRSSSSPPFFLPRSQKLSHRHGSSSLNQPQRQRFCHLIQFLVWLSATPLPVVFQNLPSSSAAMAEKRKLPARERREPAAKRRASEATPQPQSSRRKASTPVVAPSPAPEPETAPEPVDKPLPTKVKDGEALPTLSKPQPPTLTDKEYQSIAERCVVLFFLLNNLRDYLLL